ncbi:hypothetical protein D477_016680 [Arthrobacter crystallopoietes BAB-32]|uniref:Integral membrane protein n=1 Tax=Arthrobacter crystallopoietes BAB-32 TaxID=1246476 RepID=N1UVK6_9MICC|nr:hypothetical protein [Arthrobacter crystallopoietes]EMY33100.1 hypothetical protein D477_016680 [Arthrobacter crystallopoietes BAB-32]
MVELVLLVLAAASVGAIGWAIDRNRQAYGVMLLPAVGIAASVLLWFVLMAAGLGSEPGIHFLSWLLPMVFSIPAVWLTAWFLGRRRTAADLERLDAALGS